MFTDYPVAFILGGLALIYGFLGMLFDLFSFIQFFLFMPRIWGFASENLVLVAVPTFVFMGVMMERFGVAHDRTFTTLIATQDPNIVSGLAMAISTFSLTENGTLEAGPLYALEKTPKAFDIPFGYWRHAITSPKVITSLSRKAKNSDEVDRCKEYNCEFADVVYLALLRGQAPSEIVK